MYDDASYNARSYSHIFVKISARGKTDPEQLADPDTAWLSKFLDSENFICDSNLTLRDSRKIGYGETGQLVDTLVFQHDCQRLDKMRENGLHNGQRIL